MFSDNTKGERGKHLDWIVILCAQDTVQIIIVTHLVVTLGLVREQESGLQAFLSHDGVSVLMRGMQSDIEKLRTKSAFLLLNLLASHPEQKGTKERGIHTEQCPSTKLWTYFLLFSFWSKSWHSYHLAFELPILMVILWYHPIASM